MFRFSDLIFCCILDYLIYIDVTDVVVDFHFDRVEKLTSLSAQGWLSPGQIFVLEEYCARYGVRGCHRHLCFLSGLRKCRAPRLTC